MGTNSTPESVYICKLILLPIVCAFGLKRNRLFGHHLVQLVPKSVTIGVNVGSESIQNQFTYVN